jgi:hypothetical protein
MLTALTLVTVIMAAVLQGWATWDPITDLHLTASVTLGKLLKLSGAPALHLES